MTLIAKYITVSEDQQIFSKVSWRLQYHPQSDIGRLMRSPSVGGRSRNAALYHPLILRLIHSRFTSRYSCMSSTSTDVRAVYLLASSYSTDTKLQWHRAIEIES